MNRLAYLCKAPLWTVRLLVLLNSLSGFDAVAQDESNEPDVSGQSLLRDYSDNGYALRRVIPIKNLPPRIIFKKDDVSLVPDPTTRTGVARYGYAKPYMVVYLVNDTDESIAKIIGELNEVHSQVKFGGNWFSREPLQVGCGTVPAPEDLPARSALALGGISDRRGNIDGEIRYIFYIPNRRIASEPQRGRYMAGELQETMGDEVFETDLATSLHGGLLKNQWTESMAATNLEEFCAILELVRHYQLSLRDRAIIMDWILDRAEKHDATQEQAKAIVRIKGLLAKPWLIENDAQTLVDRCVAALEAKPSTSRVYVTPEKCRACVWRFLAFHEGFGQNMTIAAHEFKPAKKASMLKLAELAKASLDSNDTNVADAAAGFLGGYAITEEMISTKDILRFLESDRPLRINAGLSALAARGRLTEAIPWLLDRMKKNEPKLDGYYYKFRSSRQGEMEDWERVVLIQLFEGDPLKTLETISVSGVRGRLEKLPKECNGTLRRFLSEQLSDERRQWWANEAEQDKKGLLELDHEGNCQALSEGIYLLDTLDDPADVPLLKSLLDHPAANSNVYSGGSSTLFFTARETAKACLKRRKIAVPVSVVTRIELKPTPPPRNRTEDFMRYVLTHDFAIMGLSLTVLVGAGLALQRLRARDKVGSN